MIQSSAVRSLVFIVPVVIAILVGWIVTGYWADASVEIVRIPEGGRMPRAVIDESGVVHMVYFEGIMSGGDLLYVSRAPGASAWTEPRVVNNEPRSVIGVGPVDGGQITLDRNERIHVVWFQANPTRVFYTRRNNNGSGFEPQRILWSEGDGSFEASPSVTADDVGNVFVFWHAGAREDAYRAVYMAESHDDGESFEKARPVSDDTQGACGCCNLAALTDRSGTMYVSYRGAGENIRRGQRLLTSDDAGWTLVDQTIDEWNIGACPVTTTTLSTGPNGVQVAWETAGQVYVAPVDQLDRATSPEGDARFRRKNPVVAVNDSGDTLLAWGDGPGLRAGGTLHWLIFDAEGRPTGQQGDETTVPSGSAPTAVVRPDDSFLLIF